MTLTATVTPNPGGGSVSFTDDGAVISGCTAAAVDAGGHATCTTTLSVVGAHALVARFSGHGAFMPSTSEILTVTTPPVTVTTPPATVTTPPATVTTPPATVTTPAAPES